MNPGIGVQSVRELIAYAKKNPGKLNYAQLGQRLGAAHRRGAASARGRRRDGARARTRAARPAVQSVVAGDTQLSFATPPSVLPLVQAGRLQGARRDQPRADAARAGVPGMARGGLAGLRDLVLVRLLRAGRHAGRGGRRSSSTPPARRCKRAETSKALARDGHRGRRARLRREEFAAFLAQDATLWARLVKESGAKIE